MTTIMTSKKPAEETQPVPVAGSVEEMLLATAKAVGYGPGAPEGPAETERDIARIIHARLGWEL